MAYNSQTNHLALGFDKGAITILDGTNGDYISTLSQSFQYGDRRVSGLRYSPTGDELIAIRLYNSTLQFFEVNNNYSFDLLNSNTDDYGWGGSGYDSLVISPNNQYIVIFAYGNIRVYDRSTKELVAVASVSSAPVNLTISPNGQYLFANRVLFNVGAIINPQMTAIEIDNLPPLMNLNSSQTVNAYGHYTDGTRKLLDSAEINWKSSNPSIASINAGKLQAGASTIGTTTITASYNGHTTSAIVEVNNVKVEEKRINVAPTKKWTVTFSRNALSSSVNAQTIYVLDSKNNPVPLRFSVTAAKVQITPVSPYKSKETYKLLIKDVKSENGQTLQPYSMMEFTIR